MCLDFSDLDERVCWVIALSYSSNISKNTCRNFCVQTACLFRNLLRKNWNCLDWRKAFVPAEGSNIAVTCNLKDVFHTIPFCSILMCTAAYTLNNSVEQNHWWDGIFTQLFNKLSPFHVTPNVHCRAHKNQQWILSRDILLQSTESHCFLKIGFNIIPCRGESSEYIWPSVFQIKSPVLCPTHTTCFAHFILLYLITLINVLWSVQIIKHIFK